MGSFYKYDIMEKLHKDSQNTEFDPKKGRCEFLCNNSNSVHRPFLGVDEKKAYGELGLVLKSIHQRLLEQYGYLYLCNVLNNFIYLEYDTYPEENY